MWPAQARVANDNGETSLPETAFDPLLADALRHFAAHGLRAVDAALDKAKQAKAAGDQQANTRWLAITGMFDRRRAAAASRQLAPD